MSMMQWLKDIECNSCSDRGTLEGMRATLAGYLGRSLNGLRPEDRLSAAWLVACGPALVDRSAVVGYANEILQVEVCDRAWLEQLRTVQKQLSTELTQIAGVKVAGIHFVVKR